MLNGDKSRRTRKATQARLRQGEETDSNILSLVKERPGVSIYALSSIMKTSPGLVRGSIQRLSKKGEVDVQYVMRGGRLVTETFPRGFMGRLENDILIDKELIESLDSWKNRDQVFIYGLNRTTLGVAPYKVEEWEKKARFAEQAKVIDDGKRFLVELPFEIAEFYLWKNSFADVSAVDDLVLVTLTTQIPIRMTSDSDQEALTEMIDREN